MSEGGRPSEADIRQMKVAELKQELSSLELPITGKKEELLNRLLGHLYPGSPLSSEVESGTATPIRAGEPVVGEVEKASTTENSTSTSTSIPSSVPTSLPITLPTTATNKLDLSNRQDLLDAQKIKERQARFGIVSPITHSTTSQSQSGQSQSLPVPPPASKELSAAELEFEAKKAARLARFAL